MRSPRAHIGGPPPPVCPSLTERSAPENSTLGGTQAEDTGWREPRTEWHSPAHGLCGQVRTLRRPSSTLSRCWTPRAKAASTRTSECGHRHRLPTGLGDTRPPLTPPPRAPRPRVPLAEPVLSTQTTAGSGGSWAQHWGRAYLAPQHFLCTPSVTLWVSGKAPGAQGQLGSVLTGLLPLCPQHQAAADVPGRQDDR